MIGSVEHQYYGVPFGFRRVAATASTGLLVLAALLACKGSGAGADGEPAASAGDGVATEEDSTVGSGQVAATALPPQAPPFDGRWDLGGGRWIDLHQDRAQYVVLWRTTKQTYKGLGVLMGDKLACAWGKNTVLKIFKVNGGTLTGVSASNDIKYAGKVFNETLSGSPGIEGEYTTTLGPRWKVFLNNSGQFWKTKYIGGRAIFHGTGLVSGDTFAMANGFAGKAADLTLLTLEGGTLKVSYVSQKAQRLTILTGRKS